MGADTIWSDHAWRHDDDGHLVNENGEYLSFQAGGEPREVPVLRTYAASPFVDDHAPSGMSVKAAFEINHHGVTGSGGTVDVSSMPIPKTIDNLGYGVQFKYTNL